MRADLLERVAPLLRCPGCGAATLAIARPGTGLRCTSCGHAPVDGGGWLDFLGAPPERPSLGQRLFLSPLGARVYERLREGPLPVLTNGRTFRSEVALVQRGLALDGARVVLDVPCGQGNFTAPLARRLPDAAVIAVDLAAAQLALAARRLARDGADNVLLLRASALELPITDGAVDAVESCGGLHLYPDVPRAIVEMHRVLRPGGAVAGLTLRGHATPVVEPIEELVGRLFAVRPHHPDSLGRAFADAGFRGFRAQGPACVSYLFAQK